MDFELLEMCKITNLIDCVMELKNGRQHEEEGRAKVKRPRTVMGHPCLYFYVSATWSTHRGVRFLAQYGGLGRRHRPGKEERSQRAGKLVEKKEKEREAAMMEEDGRRPARRAEAEIPGAMEEGSHLTSLMDRRQMEEDPNRTSHMSCLQSEHRSPGTSEEQGEKESLTPRPPLRRLRPVIHPQPRSLLSYDRACHWISPARKKYMRALERNGGSGSRPRRDRTRIQLRPTPSTTAGVAAEAICPQAETCQEELPEALEIEVEEEEPPSRPGAAAQASPAASAEPEESGRTTAPGLTLALGAEPLNRNGPVDLRRWSPAVVLESREDQVVPGWQPRSAASSLELPMELEEAMHPEGDQQDSTEPGPGVVGQPDPASMSPLAQEEDTQIVTPGSSPQASSSPRRDPY